MAIDKRFECPDCGKMVMCLWNHNCTGAKKKDDETRHLTSAEQVVLHKALRKSTRPVEPKPKSEPRKITPLTVGDDRVIPLTVDNSRVIPLTAEVEFTKRKEPKSTERTKRFRERHGDTYKAYMKDYMRKWRSRSE